MRAIILLLIMYTGLVSNAFELNKAIKEFSESDKTLQDILHEFHKCQVETNEIINVMKKQLEDLQMEISMLKAEKMNAQDDKDIAEDVEVLKEQMEDRRTEIGILQDYNFENDVKIQNIQDIQEKHGQDIIDLSLEITADIDEVKINITEVKNDLSDKITDLVISPIGTIQAWSPIPEIGSENPVSIPNCWVPCDGSLIENGTWIGQHSPNLNEASRYNYIQYLFLNHLKYAVFSDFLEEG